MPTTTNKGYAVPTTGTEAGTWGDDLNLNSFATIDLNLGGVVTKTLSNANVTLTATEAKSGILRLTGALTASVVVSTTAVGFFFCENLTTGAFTVQITNGVAAYTIPQGRRAALLSDFTNGVRPGAVNDFPSGTYCLFVQTTPPPGWTKYTGYNDRALRLVSGTAGIGGSFGFSTAFAGTPTGTVGSTTLALSQIPSHNHTLPGGGNVVVADNGVNNSVLGNNAANTGFAGGGNSHLHSLTMNTLTFTPTYVDCVMASKD